MKYEEAMHKLAGAKVKYMTRREFNANKNVDRISSLSFMCLCNTCLAYYGSPRPDNAVGWDKNDSLWICLH